MKKFVFAGLVLLAIQAVAQEAAPAQPPQVSNFSSNLMETAEAPSYSDIHCAGFISKENYDTSKLVAGLESPNQTLYAGRDFIYVSGSGYQEGQRFSVVRALKDPNEYEPYKGQRHDIAEVGQPYAQLGQIRIVAIRGSNAVAEVEFSCQGMTSGDILIPFQEHAPVMFRKTSALSRFPSGPGRITARILMSNELDLLLGRGQKVFISAGSDKGVKVGDYFRAVRGYDPDKIDPVDAISYRSPVAEDTQKNPGRVTPTEAKNLPMRSLGEMIVLTVTPTSSTAMITSALESIEVGDTVELEGEQ